MKAFALILMLLPSLSLAAPLYGVDWDVLQDGTFMATDCKDLDAKGIENKNADNASFDYCACTGHITVPQMRGMTNALAQQSMNTALREAVNGAGCDETKPYTLMQDRTGSRQVSYFDVKLANTKLISFLIWNDSYEAGAAHNSWSLRGVTFDLASGKELMPSDLIDAEKFPVINQQIREELQQASFAEFAKEQLAERSSDFLTPEGCNGCAFNLTREGVEVVFQLYEVAPYADGNPKVIIYRDDLKPTIAEQL
jgi:hypothetical protein